MRGYTTEELRKRTGLTDAIVAELRFINDYEKDPAELERQLVSLRRTYAPLTTTRMIWPSWRRRRRRSRGTCGRSMRRASGPVELRTRVYSIDRRDHSAPARYDPCSMKMMARQSLSHSKAPTGDI